MTKVKMSLAFAIGVLMIVFLSSLSGTTSEKRAEAFPGPDNPYVSSQWCYAPGLAGLTLNWTSYNNGPQWVAMSHFDNGWIWGTYVLLGPFPAWQSSLTPWFPIADNAPLHILIGTVTPSGLFKSPVILITTNGCRGGPPIGSCEQNWQPGCPRPPAWVDCGATVFSAPRGPEGCVWVTRGENASYSPGDQVVLCYWIDRAMSVRLETEGPNTVVHVDGNDDGRGDCIVGNAGAVGQRTTTLFGPGGVLLDRTRWRVQ